MASHDFVQTVAKSKPNMVYIKLDSETLNKIDRWVKEIIKAKMKEKHHQIDPGEEYKRFFTGMMGECAIEKLLGKKFIDWSIGDSSFYNADDLRALGINVGIKTVEMYKFPVVHKNSTKPELICIKRTDDTILLCGLATPEILNKYQDDMLIKSPNLRKRGTKSGFYGFEHLIPIKSIEDLIPYKNTY